MLRVDASGALLQRAVTTRTSSTCSLVKALSHHRPRKRPCPSTDGDIEGEFRPALGLVMPPALPPLALRAAEPRDAAAAPSGVSSEHSSSSAGAAPFGLLTRVPTDLKDSGKSAGSSSALLALADWPAGSVVPNWVWSGLATARGELAMAFESVMEDLEGLTATTSTSPSDSACADVLASADSESLRIDDLAPPVPSRPEYEEELDPYARCEDFELVNAADLTGSYDSYSWVMVQGSSVPRMPNGRQ